MKKKLLTLMTLLVTCVTGAWADTELTLSASSDNSADSYYFAPDGTAITAIAGSGAKNKSYNSGAKITVDGTTKTATIAFTIGTGVTITSFKVTGTSNGNTSYALDGTSVTFGTALTSLSKTGSMSFVLTCTDGSGTSNRNTTITSFVVTYTTSGGGGKTALTGAWSPTSVSVTEGADAPDNPTFAVSGGATLGTDYTVTYSEVSDANNIVTTNPSTGITAISTATEGTATIRATVDLTNTTDYSIATTTYDIVITINPSGPVYKNDFTDGQIIWTPKTTIDAAVTAGWMVLGAQVSGTSPKNLKDKSLINPENEPSTIVKYTSNTDFYIENTAANSSNDRSLSMYVTGISSMSLYVWCNSTPDGRYLTIEINGTAVNTLKFATGDNYAKYISIPLSKNANNIVKIYASNQLELYAIKVSTTGEYVNTAAGRTYGTYITGSDLNFSTVSSSITAYRATGLNDGKNAVQLETVTEVPDGEPILVKTSAANKNIKVPLAASAVEPITNAFIEGDGTTDVTTDETYTYYYLASGLFHLATSGTLQKSKAYLRVLTSSLAARELELVFDEGSETTGIHSVNTEIKNMFDGEFYNLSGQRVAQPTKGLYIVNGKKVVIK